MAKSKRAAPPPAPPTSKGMSLWFVASSWVVATTLSFWVGQSARQFILYHDESNPHIEELNRLLQEQQKPAVQIASKEEEPTLPIPRVRSDKIVPKTLYSGKVTDTGRKDAVTSRTVLLEKTRTQQLQQLKWQECNADDSCPVSKDTAELYPEEEPEEEEEDDELHLPAGQHLLVDMKFLQSAFLDSEQRLAQAMVDVVWESDLTLLSYHCHSLEPSGVSCVGVLLESHISFHTWPKEGVITLDLFTCGAGLLIPLLPLVERLFGIPASVDQPIQMLWSHKLRGFRPEQDPARTVMGTSSNLGKEILEKVDLDFKRQVASVQTKFQSVDVYDVMDPRRQSFLAYQRSLDPAQEESQHPEWYIPDRRVFLDGTLQSTRIGLEAYHEALVHPAMLTHSNPKRVAIIGGGEGATLREILKHATVDTVTMIEIDEGMVETSREALPMWNDCSDISGVNCFDDPRTVLRCEDALAFFVNRFNEELVQSNQADLTERFDIIIMDALDPQDDVPFAEVLYGNPVFTKALYHALTDEGILIMQLGDAPKNNDVPDELGRSRHRASLIQDLQNLVPFQSMHTYEEPHCQFGDPWTYLIACKHYSCRQRWFANSAQVDIEIQKRILPTRSGTPALKYYDGATQLTYRLPHKAYETIFCRRPNHRAEECDYLRGYDPARPNAYLDSFEIKPTETAINDGHGVFTKVDIAPSTMIMQELASNSATFEPLTMQTMTQLAKLDAAAAYRLEGLQGMIQMYGFESVILGGLGYDIQCNLLSIVNHGCHGLYNILAQVDESVATEATADPSRIPLDQALGNHYFQDIFNPVVERHLPHVIGGYDMSRRLILAGEEVLANYLTSAVTEEGWYSVVTEMKAICDKQQR